VTEPRHWLITGRAGFIGSHLLAALVERGERVRIIDDFSTGLRERLVPHSRKFELLEGTIVDPAERTVAVYRSRQDIRIIHGSDLLEAPDVIPTVRVPVEELSG